MSSLERKSPSPVRPSPSTAIVLRAGALTTGRAARHIVIQIERRRASAAARRADAAWPAASRRRGGCCYRGGRSPGSASRASLHSTAPAATDHATPPAKVGSCALHLFLRKEHRDPRHQQRLRQPLDNRVHQRAQIISGYAEGTLFPWTVSDFSLMDAIECGIVKLPRVPVADNIPGEELPVFRNLWEHIRTKMPKKRRGKSEILDPLSLPVELQTALEALYGHYAKTFDLWAKSGIKVPPCFIVVCNNTATSKLVYDYISGFHRENEDGSTTLENGRLAALPKFRRAR